MVQRHSSGVSPSQIQRGVGYIPPREAVGANGVTVDGGPNPVVGGPSVGVSSVSFGVGVPPVSPAPLDGSLYFDTTIAVYVGYVGNGGVWNKF